jgi:hypothetical protein
MNSLATGALTASDWFQFLGVIVAAVVGVLVAVWGQRVARRSAYIDRVDTALAAVIITFGRRATELDAWASPAEVPVAGSLGMRATRGARTDARGGPIDVELQTAIEAAWLVARTRRDRTCLEALARAVDGFKSATVHWQIEHLGELAASIRRWRTRVNNAMQFRNEMQALEDAALGGRTSDAQQEISV